MIEFPAMSRPAMSALEHAGYTYLDELDGVPMASILELHGMGPRGIGALRHAMEEHGWSFTDDDLSVGAPPAEPLVTPGRQPDRNDNQTGPTDVVPAEWIASLPTARQRDDGAQLLQIFGKATGVEPVMWGPSIVGYGALHYRYASGREGDTAKVGFSPRSSAISLYGLQVPGAQDHLVQLGRHRLGAGCVYVPTLAQANLDVLAEVVALAWRA
ncbi:helix-hairpin-helix domain-containing protein [Parenemella sanctibonifatiensis]|uniref:helix-hairpin-helix domain-containing protein n=1 Tax=Parenemella sanctibonifatiensis TaxID=2016505 RepID=UPI0015C59FF0|nr:helix-hairpin-helix domain-containing protein [Parenemella sanctibonifatiensis]